MTSIAVSSRNVPISRNAQLHQDQDHPTGPGPAARVKSPRWRAPRPARRTPRRSQGGEDDPHEHAGNAQRLAHRFLEHLRASSAPSARRPETPPSRPRPSFRPAMVQPDQNGTIIDRRRSPAAGARRAADAAFRPAARCVLPRQAGPSSGCSGSGYDIEDEHPGHHQPGQNTRPATSCPTGWRAIMA